MEEMNFVLISFKGFWWQHNLHGGCADFISYSDQNIKYKVQLFLSSGEELEGPLLN